MKSQPSQLGEVEPSIAHSSIYAVNKNTSSIVVTAKTKPNSVIIDEESIDRMEFESVSILEIEFSMKLTNLYLNCTIRGIINFP